MQPSISNRLHRELDDGIWGQSLGAAAPASQLKASGVRAVCGDGLKDHELRKVRYHLARLPDTNVVTPPGLGA